MRLHVKNNRAGEPVFRITEARLHEAGVRRPAVARRLSLTCDAGRRLC